MKKQKTPLATPLTERWKKQIRALFDQKRADADKNELYKKLFEYYYVKKYHAPAFYDKQYAEWKTVKDFLAEQLRQSFLPRGQRKDYV